MDELIKKIERLRNDPIRNLIDMKMSEFVSVGQKNSNQIFKELCFCFMTANFNAEKSIKMQNAIGDGFLHLPEDELAKRLTELGHRFPNARARFMILARPHKDTIKETLSSFSTDQEKREWIVKTFTGIGMKEASHFLRNIGHKNLAIIDFHIVDLLVREGLVERPKTMTPKKYLEIEKVLEDLCNKTGLCQGELDLYLWYEETGKVFK